MPNYVKIPREIIYDKDLGDKRVIIFSYLCARRALDDTVAFSITELCHWSNLKPNYRDGKINQKYYEVLLLLSHYGYFVECPDFESCLRESTNSVKYQQVKLNIEKFRYGFAVPEFCIHNLAIEAGEKVCILMNSVQSVMRQKAR